MSARGLPHPSASDALDPPLCLAWRRTTGRLPALWPAGCGKGGLAGRCEPGMRLQPEPLDTDLIMRAAAPEGAKLITDNYLHWAAEERSRSTLEIGRAHV